MSHYFLFDNTTLAVMMPSFVLSCFIFLALRFKRIPLRALLQLVVSLGLLPVHATIFWLCCNNFSWLGYLPTTLSAYGGVIYCMLYNLLLSLLFMCPIVIFTQAVVCKIVDISSGKSRMPLADFVIRCSITCSLLHIALPLLLYFVAMSCNYDFGLWLARDLFRVSLALITVPISLVGMGVAFYGYPLYRGSLSDLMLFRSGKLTTCVLSNKSHDELDKLIVAALSLREFEVAEWISLHLLQRYEQL